MHCYISTMLIYHLPLFNHMRGHRHLREEVVHGRAPTELLWLENFRQGITHIIIIVLNNDLAVAQPHSGSLSTISGRTGIWKCWVLRREESQSTQRKTSRGKGENQKLNPQWRPCWDLTDPPPPTPLHHPCFPKRWSHFKGSTLKTNWAQ